MLLILQLLVIALVLALGYWAFRRRGSAGCPVCAQNEGACKSEGDACRQLKIKKPDDKFLLFITKLPLGASYKQIKLTFPQIPDIKVPGEKDSFEINAPVKFLNKTAYVNLHLKNKTLDRYYFWLKDLKETEQDRLFDEMKRYYETKLSPSMQEQDDSSVQCTWNTESFRIKLTKLKNDHYEITWGFEPPQVT